jgi:hypothetical protein
MQRVWDAVCAELGWPQTELGALAPPDELEDLEDEQLDELEDLEDLEDLD